MKQTAVEFLFKQLEAIRKNYNTKAITAEQAMSDRKEALNIAKEMEKLQITCAYNKSTYQFANDAEVIEPKSALEYYNETYKK